MIAFMVAEYGAGSMSVFAIGFTGRGLGAIARWDGHSIVVQALGADGHPIVIVTRGGYYDLPRLFRWGDGRFIDADGDFPSYFAKLGYRYGHALGEPRPALPPAAIAAFCGLALGAYAKAGEPEIGASDCNQALTRIEDDRGLVYSRFASSAERIEEREAARRSISQQLRSGPARMN